MGLAIAQRMGYSSEHLIEFGYAAMFRDIGLMQIEEKIVYSSASLTISQYEKIRQHTIFSEQILIEMGVTSEVVLDIVRHHHEKLDGTGYPDKLKNKEIGTLVRVCNVVDIFDALTTDRIHKKALSSYDALKLMNTEMKSEIDFDILKGLITMLGFSK